MSYSAYGGAQIRNALHPDGEGGVPFHRSDMSTI